VKLSTLTSSAEPRLHPFGWRRRDFLAAAALFSATAAVVLWQNAHLAVLWDLSYTLDSSLRIALGQIPYRDFPFVHPPLTFLIQAAIIRCTGRVFFHHVLYAAIVGGLGTVLAWRIALHTLQGRLSAAWAISLLLAAPLTVLGIYCILPFPSYDCDTAFSVLLAIFLLQRLPVFKPCVRNEKQVLRLAALAQDDSKDGASSSQSLRIGLIRAFTAGVAVVLPLFFKQNIGLPFLVTVTAAILLLLANYWMRGALESSATPDAVTLMTVLAGMTATLLSAALVLQCIAGIGNYLHWTIQFAAQRRLPGLGVMLGVYRQPSLLWMLPCIVAALVLLQTRLAKARWSQLLALGLLATPFLWTLFTLFLYDDADERGDSLLALWPLLLLLSAVLTLFNLRRTLSLRTLLPVIVLAAIHGTFLSQQLWGSTYAIWPLLIFLVAEIIAYLATFAAPRWAAAMPLALTVVIAVTLLVCGGFYTASEERLSYAQFPEGPVQHSTFPQLRGMAVSGPYLANFEDLLRYTDANIPHSDGILILPGEDPFYFVTGRVPQFPVLLFDPATDPYSSAQLVEQVRARNIHWLIVKRELQIKEDPTPQREATLQALQSAFILQSRLQGYDVYRRP
jgi:hypothetical protein